MKFLTTILLALVTLLAGCESSLDRRYLDTSLEQPLELPPDLSKFELDSNFDLPGSFESSELNARNKVPVLAQVASVKLQGSGDFYWLDVKEPVENLYQLVKNFWAFEGYGLVIDEPVIGIMQTEWIYTEKGVSSKDKAWWELIFDTDDLSASQDQFHTRIERDDARGTSRIYLAHRGTEYNHEIRIGDQFSDNLDNQWQFRRSEPELEVEMLSRLMVYLGLQQEAVDSQVASIKLFKPRARLAVDAEENSPFLVLLDPYQIAWNRLHHLLLRMNFQIEYAEFQSGLLDEGEIVVKAEIVDVEADKGFFNFFSDEERRERKFTLVLTEETHEVTLVILEDEKGNFDTTPEGSEFLSLLYEQIK